MASGKTIQKNSSIDKDNQIRKLREAAAASKKQTQKSASYTPKENPAAPKQTIMDGNAEQEIRLPVYLPSSVVPDKPGPVAFEPEFDPKPILKPITIQKPETKKTSAFPTFGEIQNQENGLTDLFLPQPSLSERIGEGVRGSFAGGMAGLNQAGSFLIDQGVKREQERENSGAGGNLFFQLLDLAGWNTDPEKYENQADLEPFAGEAEKARETVYRGLSPAEEGIADFGMMAGDLLANATIAGATGVPLPVFNAIQQAGESGAYALQQGKDADTALAYALGSGALSYGIEQMGGVAGDWGQKLLQKAGSTAAGQAVLQQIPQQVSDYIQKLSANKLARLIGTGAEEGLEEFNEYSLQLLLRNIMLDEDTPFDIKEALANAGAGLVFGSAMRSADLLTDLDVSGIRDAAKTRLDNGKTFLENSLETGTAKPDFDSPLIPRSNTGSETQNTPTQPAEPQRRFFDYADKDGKAQAMNTLHQQMMQDGKTVVITGEDLAQLSEYYPDLRSMKKADRTPILKERRKAVTAYIKNLLHNMFDGQKIEFSIDGNVIEARVYSDGINHVSDNLTPQKSAMLTKSREIFDKAEYLYSSPNDVHGKASGNDQIKQWDYFYVPISVDGQTGGVRIAIRNLQKNDDFQIYDWRIKNGESYLHPEAGGRTEADPLGTSSNSPHDSSVSQTEGNVNNNLLPNAGEGEFDSSGQDRFSELLNIRKPEVDTSVLQVRPQSFDSELLTEQGKRKSSLDGLDKLTGQTPAEEKFGRSNLDALKEIYQKWDDAGIRLQNAIEKAEPTDAELHALESIAKGYQTLQDYQNHSEIDLEKVSGLLQLQQDFDGYDQEIQSIRAAMHEEVQQEVRDALSHITEFNPKKTVIQYELDTPERNFRDIFSDPKQAQEMIDTFLWGIHVHNAQKNKFINDLYRIIGENGFSVKEFEWMQKIGDQTAEGHVDWEQLPDDLNRDRIQQGIKMFNDIYPGIFQRLQDAQISIGEMPSRPRSNYFPHYQKSKSRIIRAMDMLGYHIKDEELPGWMRGYTEYFNPKRQWSANLEHRDGNQTEFNAYEGFRRYIEPIANIIYHGEDIQKLRALEDELILQSVGLEGMQKVRELRNDPNLNAEEREQQIEKLITDKDKDQKWGTFRVWLHNYTNLLAGKKSVYDRPIENALGRFIYSASNAVESLIAKNAVAANVSVAASNLGALAPGLAGASLQNQARALYETARGIDDLTEYSVFLTNRAGIQTAEPNKLLKTKEQIEQFMASTVDQFTSKAIVKARYLTNLDHGMDAKAALKEADEWAAKVMGDRSKGARPTIFEAKNPFIKLFTMFQLEANNQVRHLFKDVPDEIKKQSAPGAARYILTFLLYHFLFNEARKMLGMSEFLTDPVGMAEDARKDFTDPELTKKDAASNLKENLMNLVPFNNLFSGNPRYFTDGAIPQITRLIDSTIDLTNGDASPDYVSDLFLQEAVDTVGSLNPIIPYSQTKKTVQGLDAFLNAGVYQKQKDGSEQLLFPIEQNAPNLLQSIALGAYSGENAKEYFRYRKPVQPGNIEGQIDAKARALPRLLSYSYGEDENRQQGQIMLTEEQRQNFEDSFRALIPDNMGTLDAETRNTIYQYAEKIAQDEALAAAGVPEYEPESWVMKMKAAADAGIPPEQYLEYKETLSGITEAGGQNGAERKRETLLNDPDLSAEQKLILDQQLISAETKADYTDQNSFYLSQMKESRRRKFGAAESAVPGMTAQEFEWEMDALAAIQPDKNADGTTVSGSKKEKQLEYLREQGYSMQEAYDLYNIQNLPSDWSGASEYGVSYDAFTDSMKKQYQAVTALFGEVSTAKFEYYRDLVQTANGTEEKVRTLEENGFSTQQAASFLAALSISESDNIDFTDPNAVLLSTLSSTQQQKYKAAADYFPGMPVSDYIYFRDGIADVEGERDAFGKTISGTKKARQIAKLMQMGMNYSQALTFYNIVG